MTFGFTCLHYFNVCGSDREGVVGEDHTPETHLIPVVIQAALGRRASVAIFGTDYPTPDGTCIRDYVHVEDLADAHIAAMNAIKHKTARHEYNLGIGKGYSVRQIIEVVQGVRPRLQGHRRAAGEGRPARSLCRPEQDQSRTRLAQAEKVTDLSEIIASAYRSMEKAPPGGMRRENHFKGVRVDCIAVSSGVCRRGLATGTHDRGSPVAAQFDPDAFDPGAGCVGTVCGLFKGLACTLPLGKEGVLAVAIERPRIAWGLFALGVRSSAREADKEEASAVLSAAGIEFTSDLIDQAVAFEASGSFIARFTENARKGMAKRTLGSDHFVVATLTPASVNAKVPSIERTGFAFYNPVTPKGSMPRKARGIALVMPGIFGTPEGTLEALVASLRRDGWHVLRMLAQPSRFTQAVSWTIDPAASDAQIHALGRDIAGADQPCG